MKKVFLILSLLGLSSVVFAQKDKKAQDVAAIKSMCGCYEVTFEFGETFSPDTTYQFHKNHKSVGLEWVQLVEEGKDKLVLQHLLLANDTTIIKHWRQDWLYENTNLYLFKRDNHWQFTQLPKAQVAGQWTQKVFQVDDSPRYEGSATWIHYDGRHYWENTTDAPLPRREFTTRQDYNVMKRRNRQEITSYGWQHEQDNDKIVRSEAGDKLIASEKGWNTYRKVESSRCQGAQKWWTVQAPLWAHVRKEWESLFAQQKDIRLAGKVDGQPLFTYLFALKPDAKPLEIHQVVTRFITK